MNADETIAMLDKTVDNQAKREGVEEWLVEQGIDKAAFTGYLHRLIVAANEAPLKPKPSPFFYLSLGFGLGWDAHRVMLETPIEARPAPDLSDSLE